MRLHVGSVTITAASLIVGRRTTILVFIGLMAATVFSQPRVIVDQNVQVSRFNSGDPHAEILLAADPNTPQRLLGCALVRARRTTISEYSAYYQVVAYASFDGGKSWEATLKDAPNLLSMSDPACMYGPADTAYFITVGYSPQFHHEGFLYRSKDGGKTWLPPVRIPRLDTQFISVDDTQSTRRGYVYIHGIRSMMTDDDGSGISGLAILRSADNGATFFPEVTLTSAAGYLFHIAGNSVILSDGTLVIPFGELNDVDAFLKFIPPVKSNAKLKVVISEDGGEQFSKAVVVSDWSIRNYSNINGVPSLAVDRSGGPFKDRLYLAWPDVRSGRCEIFFTYSADRGRTWSKPITVNDDRPRASGDGPDDFMPTLAVNRDGVVGVMWYDRRDNLNNLGWQVRFAASLDGGETFLPSVKVSEMLSDPDRSDWVMLRGTSRGGGDRVKRLRGSLLDVQISLDRFTFMGGDYAGMAADPTGLFHPFWIDNRTGIPQIWTSSVRVEGASIKDGVDELKSLDDITQKVTLDLLNPEYDPKTNTISVEAYLVNTSKETLTVPLRVRILKLTSEFGIPVVLNGDNKDHQQRALIDFTTLVPGGALRPEQRSGAKRITFRLSEARPFRPRGLAVASTTVVGIKAKVLGKIQAASRD